LIDLSTRFLPWPIVLGLAMIAAAGAVALYARERRVAPRAQGRWLAGLRGGAAALLVLAAFDPGCVVRRPEARQGEVLCVVDASRSFALTDAHRPSAEVDAEARAVGWSSDQVLRSTRRERAARALEVSLLPGLAQRGQDVRLFALSSELLPFVGEPPPADGSKSDLVEPLARELGRASGSHPRAVILLTDGNHHGRGDARGGLRALSTFNVPVIAVGVGALERPPDLELAEVDAPGRAFEGDEVKAQVTVNSAGLPAGNVALRVTDGQQLLASSEIAAPAGGTARGEISFKAGAPGRRKLTFALDTLAGEASAENNSRDAWLEVFGGKARVLLLDGAPRWEERYLRASWTRDAGVELESFLVHAPPEAKLPAGFPRTRDGLFAHDVIVLGDVDPGVFSREEIETLRDFVVARGGTLVLIAGERAMPYRWVGTPLAEMLPVEPEDPSPAPGQGSALARGVATLGLTAAGEGLEMTRLVAGRERNFELWGLLPPPAWICPTRGARPGATVLCTAGSTPALVTRSAGAGQVLFSAIDSTWRWRYRFGDELHGRFWGQVVRWALAARLGAADDVARLSTDAAVYEPGATVTVEALVTAPGAAPQSAGVSGPSVDRDAPRTDAIVRRLRDGKEGRLRLDPVPRSGGRLRGASTLEALDIAAQPGPSGEEFSVQLDIATVAGYAQRADRASVHFVVESAADPERGDLACDTELLTAIAAATGGKFVPLSRVGEALDALPAGVELEERTSERRLWDHGGLVAALLIGLVAVEWALRKRCDLL